MTGPPYSRMNRSRTNSQLAGEVVSIGQHRPLIRDAEDRCADVVGGPVDVDVRSDRPSRLRPAGALPRPCRRRRSSHRLDALAHGRVVLTRLKRGNEHRAQEIGGFAYTPPVCGRRDPWPRPGRWRRVGSGAEALHVLVQEERLEDGVLASVAGVHHRPAVARAAPDFSGCRCFPALFDDQLRCRLPTSRRLDISTRSGCVKPRAGEGTLAY